MSSPAFKLVAPEQLDLGELNSSIGFLLRLAQVKAFDGFYGNLTQYGLKPGEFSVLWVIGLNPGVKQGVLAQQLVIKAAHMTKLVQRLVKAGFILRQTSDEDRRSVHLALSESGHAFVDRHRKEFLTFVGHENGTLSKTDMEQLRRLLRKFIATGD